MHRLTARVCAARCGALSSWWPCCRAWCGKNVRRSESSLKKSCRARSVSSSRLPGALQRSALCPVLRARDIYCCYILFPALRAPKYWVFNMGMSPLRHGLLEWIGRRHWLASCTGLSFGQSQRQMRRKALSSFVPGSDRFLGKSFGTE